jgi:hypothetical protein
MILNITKAEFINGTTFIDWDHNFQEVELFNIIFDANTSCSQFSISGDKKSVAIESFEPVENTEYFIKLKALANGKWLESEEVRLYVR